MEFFPEQSNDNDLRLAAANILESETQAEPDDPGSKALLKLENDFDSYDKDNNGFLTVPELEAIESSKNSDQDLKRIAGLLKRDIKSVEEYSNDEFLDENDGITARDLNKLRLSDHSVPQPGFSNWFRDHFSALGDTFSIGIVPIADPLSWGEKQVPTMVLHVYKGSAAEYAGLKSNDLITKVNGEDITQMSSTDVKALLDGVRASNVTLEIKRDGFAKTITIPRKKQISVDTPRTRFDSNVEGPSRVKGKDADPTEVCQPFPEYTRLIKKAAFRHYDPFSLGDLKELTHKYDCVIDDTEEAHNKAERELKSLTGDNYLDVKDRVETEEQETEEEAIENKVHVEDKDLGDGIAYIKLADFREKSDTDAMEEAIKKYEDAEAFVIDLRGNPGGLMSVAIEISSMLVPQGDILKTFERQNSDPASPIYAAENYSLSNYYLETMSTLTNGTARYDLKRRQAYLLDGRPMVLLVNNQSASAAEIVAGAVKDNEAGTLVGKTTFGKGIGQETVNINSQHSIKMTTFRFTSPDGTWPGDAQKEKIWNQTGC